MEFKHRKKRNLEVVLVLVLVWFCFPCEEEVHRRKKRGRKKESLKPKQPERDSPLLVWFGMP